MDLTTNYQYGPEINKMDQTEIIHMDLIRLNETTIYKYIHVHFTDIM